MIFDYHATLSPGAEDAGQVEPHGLASGFVERCSVWAHTNKNKKHARDYYTNQATNHSPSWPDDLNPEPDFESLPSAGWLGIRVDFILETPWYSRDDRPFHLLDNPVKKDRLFGLPFMSASSWKGLLRWTCRMHAGLLEHLREHDMKMEQWQDPPWIVHLFGSQKPKSHDDEKDENLVAGALAFYPTWFNSIGFCLINPHSRQKRAGTKPILYEVVPDKSKGSLSLLYTPSQAGQDTELAQESLSRLIDSMQALLETYGFSAKRTVGWGTAKINSCRLFYVEGSPLWQNTVIKSFKSLEELKAKLENAEWGTADDN